LVTNLIKAHALPRAFSLSCQRATAWEPRYALEIARPVCSRDRSSPVAPAARFTFASCHYSNAFSASSTARPGEATKQPLHIVTNKSPPPPPPLLPFSAFPAWSYRGYSLRPSRKRCLLDFSGVPMRSPLLKSVARRLLPPTHAQTHTSTHAHTHARSVSRLHTAVYTLARTFRGVDVVCARERARGYFVSPHDIGESFLINSLSFLRPRAEARPMGRAVSSG
jgi:hypothetical protein